MFMGQFLLSIDQWQISVHTHQSGFFPAGVRFLPITAIKEELWLFEFLDSPV